MSVSPASARRPPPIDEIVGLLSTRASGALEELRTQEPMLAAELKPGIIAGTVDGLLLSRARVAVRGLSEMIAASDRELNQSEKKLRFVRKLRLLAQVCTAVGSASGVGFSAAALMEPALVSGVVALTGSIAMVGVDHFGTLGDAKLIDHYVRVRELRFDAQGVLRELDLRVKLRKDEWDDAVIDQLIRDANALAKRIDAELAKSHA